MGPFTLESLGAFLAALGIKFGVLLASAIGGFLSLSFFEGTPQADGTAKPPSSFQKWCVVGVGGALGTYGAGPIIELAQISTKTDRLEVAIGLMLGLFGMSLTAAIIKTIRDLNIAEIVKNWLPKRG